MQTRQSDLSALPWSPGPSAGVSVGGGGYSEPQIRCCWLNSVAPTQWWATGPCRTHQAPTWFGHRSCWAASRQC